MGCSPPQCRNGIFRSFTRMLTLTLPYTKALEIEPSLIAYIAKSLAHVGDGERDKAYRACDIAFECFRSSHITFLLLGAYMFVLGFLILLRSLRLSSCLRQESPLMRSHGWTTLLLLSATTQFVMWSRCAYDALLLLNSTADVFNRHTWIFSETRSWRAATTRMR